MGDEDRSRAIIKLKQQRQTWGSGHHAGYRAGLIDAGIKNIEEFMSSAQRLKNIESNLNSQTKKVLHAMPVGEEVSLQWILRALSEAGKGISLSALQRSVMDIVDSGLARKGEGDTFVRRSIEEPSPAHIVAKSNVPRVSELVFTPGEVFAPDDKPVRPLDKLSNLAQELRALATRIDDAVLEVEEEMQSISTETSKLSKLKELLNSL